MVPATAAYSESPMSVFPVRFWETQTPAQAGLDEAVLNRLSHQAVRLMMAALMDPPGGPTTPRSALSRRMGAICCWSSRD
jgi:hypothetical protein